MKKEKEKSRRNHQIFDFKNSKNFKIERKNVKSQTTK